MSITMNNSVIATVNNFEKQDYCVYGYWVDGVCRYVGHGGNNYKRYEDKSNRTEESLALLNNPNMEIRFFANGLTKKEATAFENNLLDLHFGKHSDEYQLVNKTGSRSARTIYWAYFDEIVYYDETSPTCLRWKNDMLNSKGWATKASKDGIAGYLPKNTDQYAEVRIDDILYRVHRVIFAIKNKANVCETLVVNHIDSNRQNNNIFNLELTTQKDNSRKAKMKNTNTSGVSGVCKIPKVGGWRARWRDEDGKNRSKEFHLNKFEGTLEEKEQQSFDAACEYRSMIERELYKIKKE